MFQIQSILFPIAFSKRDEAAAPFVLSLAQRYHARVVAMHVRESPPQIYAGMGTVFPEAFELTDTTEDLRSELQDFAHALLPKLPVECVVEPGDAACVIVDYACTHAADLIAMPTHGYGGIQRCLLGSVTAKVLHGSRTPVWTSAHTPEPSHRAHPKPRRILCAIDMRPESRRTLEVAIALANDSAADLELVHVPAETVAPEAAERHLHDLLVEAAQSENLHLHQMSSTPVDWEGEGGNVAEAVRALALRERADLVVIGRGAIQTGFGRLRAHCYEIIRACPCPVLSV